jgi:hypothetical protein
MREKAVKGTPYLKHPVEERADRLFDQVGKQFDMSKLSPSSRENLLANLHEIAGSIGDYTLHLRKAQAEAAKYVREQASIVEKKPSEVPGPTLTRTPVVNMLTTFHGAVDETLPEKPKLRIETPDWLEKEIASAKHLPGEIQDHIESAATPVEAFRRLAAAAHRESRLNFPRYYATSVIVHNALGQFDDFGVPKSEESKEAIGCFCDGLNNLLRKVEKDETNRRWSTYELGGLERLKRTLEPFFYIDSANM